MNELQGYPPDVQQGFINEVIEFLAPKEKSHWEIHLHGRKIHGYKGKVEFATKGIASRSLNDLLRVHNPLHNHLQKYMRETRVVEQALGLPVEEFSYRVIRHDSMIIEMNIAKNLVEQGIIQFVEVA